jgi:menaquinone-9 beta-reductase
MDALLAETFQQRGGKLQVHSRLTLNSDDEGIISATGRRLQPAEKDARWFGVKAHVSNSTPVNLEADLEMHLSPDGYAGITRINDGEINVCGLFKSRPETRRPESKTEWLRGEPGSLLHKRLDAAQFDPDSFCSVAGIQLKPQRASEKQECCIGDALTMTPPVTGNGMSMAFESAEMAIEPLAAYSRGELNWTQAQRQIALQCDAAFSSRLAWARVLQWLMVSPAVQSGLGGFLLRSNWLWRLMFERTR